MGRIQWLALAILLLAMVAAEEARPPTQWHYSYYPNPQTEPEKCGRTSASWVCDPNHLLEKDEAEQLNNVIKMVGNKTTCPCSHDACERFKGEGYRIAVALVEGIYWAHNGREKADWSDNERLQMAQNFAYHLLKKWAVSKCDDGVLIFYSAKDNLLWTMSSAVAADKLTPQLIGEVSMGIRGEFYGPLFDALRVLISKYKLVFLDQYKQELVPKPVTPGAQPVMGSVAPSSTGVLSLVVAVALFSALLFC